ncbi:hypothetical protein NHX12_006978 [Muraenolepis orangiensis]|uniref:Taste receptor type 2 n=1 Tax=Muraenolepis orangiensis TaxID=630683 RepID=A0A9Q0DP47_9TELE|nr:hypothetical protein NHX12_006978 [Muraenolepis orangiensis]
MTSYVWLMFYYYIMIVPSQRAIIRWVKKNIKSIIYVMLFGDRLLFLGNAAYEITLTLDSLYSNGTDFFLQDIAIVEFSILSGYVLLCLCVMIFSSFATAHYLSKHMKSLAASDGSLFNPRLLSQIRVTITGILQGVLYLLFGLWYIANMLCYYLPPYVTLSFFIRYTATTLYISITTLNLWVGQTLFRERAVHVWKAVKKHVCTGKEDLRPAEDTLTTAATIQSTGVDTDG